MTYPSSGEVVHEPTWFGPNDGPLYGWLSIPMTSMVKGGVVLAPPVGFEARGARRAFRALATSLAESGYVALRFDYRGTGDSSGDFGSALPNPKWLDDINTAVNYLRDCGITSVSAVGMRLGATLVGVVASRRQLDLDSFVAWDPCESGRSYLRELRALENLRRTRPVELEGDAVETAEFRFSDEMANAVRSLDLSQSSPTTFAKRTLVMSRKNRPLSSRFRAHFEKGVVEFETTEEQEALIDVPTFTATTPLITISRIVEWITNSAGTIPIAPRWNFHPETHLASSDGKSEIIERTMWLGPRKLFAIIDESKEETLGPWIVLLGGINEDHTGPSRLWVELSRRWAAAGLHCIRVDVSGMGETPRCEDDPPMHIIDPVWTRDVHMVASIISPADPSNCVYVGMCSGAFLAIEGAFGSGANGVCLVNPPPWTDYAHAITRLQNMSWRLSHLIAKPLQFLFEKRPLIGAVLWRKIGAILPKRWAINVINEILLKGTVTLVLAGPEDLKSYARTPILRLSKRAKSMLATPYQFIYVPELDHHLSSETGRERMRRILEEDVQSRYGACQVL